MTTTHSLFPTLTAVFFLANITLGQTNGPSDAAIGLAIENRILRSDEIRSHDLRAEVENGAVVLSGKVDNLLASRSAIRAAQEVRGVKTIINQIRVETPPVADKQLTDRVVANLATSGLVDSDSIKVAADGGIVTLSGEVESLSEKWLADDAAASVAGVASLESKITIATGGARSDDEMREEIAGLIDHSAVLDENKIEVSVEDGVAELSGRVGSLAQKAKAAQLASIAGVREVRDGGLRVEWKLGDGMQRQRRFETLTDEKIRDAILLGVRNHPLLVAAGDKLDVSVKGAQVTLDGELSRLEAKEAAAAVARETIGVQGVRNRIRVAWPEKAPDDEALTKMAIEALERDAYLGFAEIIPRTRNAHVHLYGVVDTEFEKARAGFIAGAQPGVVHVANYLTVLGEWDPRPDAEIEEDIRERLALIATDPHVKVDVDVKGGVPVLTGHVATWFQWQGLVDICQKAGGRRPHIQVSIHYRPQRGAPDLYVPQ